MVQETHAKERKKESVHHKINSPVSIFILVGFFPRAHDFHPFLNFRSKHCNFDLLVTPYESALNRNYNDMNCLCVSLRWFFFLLGLINQLFYDSCLWFLFHSRQWMPVVFTPPSCLNTHKLPLGIWYQIISLVRVCSTILWQRARENRLPDTKSTICLFSASIWVH